MKEPIILHDHIMGWNDFIRDMTEEMESGRLDPITAQEQFTIAGVYHRSLHLMWMLLLGYRRQGQQTFVVGSHLQQRLEHTSLSGVPADMLRPPYQVFYVAFPDSKLRLWGGSTGWHPLTGILVGFNSKGQATFYLWGAENEASTRVGDDASFWFSLDIQEANQQGKDLEEYLDLVMTDKHRDMSDAKMLAESGHPLSTALRGAQIEFPEKGPVAEEVRATALAAMRIVLNLCIYLQSNNADLSEHPSTARNRAEKTRLKKELSRKKNPRKKGRGLLKQIERLSDAHVTWVGRGIEEAHEREEAKRQTSGGRIRHWVRSHWWPRLSNKEARERHGIRWVMSHERGVDAPEAEPSRHYRFGDDEPPRS